MKHLKIAVIGAGPAGSLAAANLASAGHSVSLFDEKPPWEKPCGGGLTHKAVSLYPFLRDAKAERNWISQCEIVSPRGRRVLLALDQPIAIFSRRVLNELLLNRAAASGAHFQQTRITAIEGNPGSWRLRARDANFDAHYLIIATGARNPFRAQFSLPFGPGDLMATAGYYIAGTSPVMQLRFLSGLHGYVWIFPRADHFSAGICGKLNSVSTAQLRSELEKSLKAIGLSFAGSKFYSHVLPALSLNTLRHAPVSGTGWAMVGDAAGLADPVTGEGLYYALRSADLVSECLLEGRPEAYHSRLQRDFLCELQMAARIADRFFTGSWMGEAVTERMVQFTKHSPEFQQLMCDMFSGSQAYESLRRRLYGTLPLMLVEGAISVLGLRRRDSKLTASKAS
jgi:flavin-dependent dehydrogenase